jgi:sorting nexin-29
VGVGFNVTDQLLIRFLFHQILERNGSTMRRYQLFVDFKKAYDSVGREVLYNILIEFGIPMKLVRLIKMCVNVTCSKIHIGKHSFDKSANQNGLKQGDAVRPLL